MGDLSGSVDSALYRPADVLQRSVLTLIAGYAIGFGRASPVILKSWGLRREHREIAEARAQLSRGSTDNATRSVRTRTRSLKKKTKIELGHRHRRMHAEGRVKANAKGSANTAEAPIAGSPLRVQAMRKITQPATSDQQDPSTAVAAAFYDFTITQPSDLVSLLLIHLDQGGPRIPLKAEASHAIFEFSALIIHEQAPKSLACLAWDGLDQVCWDDMDDPDVERHGLALVRLVHLTALGMNGVRHLGYRGVKKSEAIPLERVIDMIFAVEPALSSLLRVRDRKSGRCLITTTEKGRAAFGGHVRVEMDRIGLMPPDEVFDLAVPYDA